MSARTCLTQWLMITVLGGSAGAAAQSDELEPAPPRYVATWSVGAPLRLSQQADFGQDTLGPVFTDVLGGYVFPSTGSFQHGAGLGVSLNLSDDGGYAEPVYAAEQVAIMPAYLLYLDLGMDWFGVGHVGVPVNLTGGTTAGAELAATLGYRLLAGAGVFTELSANAFVGAGSALHPTLALELGLFLDFEVLP